MLDVGGEAIPDVPAKAGTARLYAQLADRIAKQILLGQYKVGDRLPSERELSQAFEVSRPTIREAIIALELDGLVEVRVGSGVELGPEEIDDLDSSLFAGT